MKSPNHSAQSSPPSPTDLSTEAAMAARIIRSSHVPRQLFQWLASPGQWGPCTEIADGIAADEQLTRSFSDLLAPLMAAAREWEKKETRHAAGWLGAACRCASQQFDQLQLEMGPRLIATSLLPLYRSLASGNLQDGFRQSRCRLSELLSLSTLCYEVGDDLVALLGARNLRNESPSSILSKLFDLDLTHIAAIVCQHVSGFDGETTQFTPGTADEIRNIKRDDYPVAIPEWAAPELLWRLAGELISKNSELVLPRSWIDVAVPWNKVADHWNQLSYLLLARNQESSPSMALSGVSKGLSNGASSGIAKSVSKSVASNDQSSALAESCVTQSKRSGNNGMPSSLKTHRTSAAEGSNSVNDDAADEDVTLGTIAELTSLVHGTTAHSSTAQRLSSTEAASPESALPVTGRAAGREANGPAGDAPATTASAPKNAVAQVLPKVIIAEVRSHNDPVFVNVIRRQIAKCRAEDRALSLVSMVVLPENESEKHDVYENGLTLWQQKLVNWLADHPHVVEPYAFLTSDGNLLLCLLDLERNETTTLVRHGLVEVLTGQSIDECQGNLLAKVNVPARYHAGIASTGSPGAGLSPEQLIEPAIRCLSAASRHGKASIKSIEVY